MKKIKNYIGLSVMLFLAVFYGCQDDDQTFGDIVTPSNLTLTATVQGVTAETPNGPGTGLVDFEAHADNAITYKYVFGDGGEQLAPQGTATYAYTETGTHEFIVTVIATGTGGVATSTTTTVIVYSEFDDPVTKGYLTGGSSKTWYIAKALPGHLGLGPVETPTQDWYSAAAFEKEDCFYNDEFVFTQTPTGGITLDYDNMGESFFNVSYLSLFGGSGTSDACLPYDSSGTKNVALAAASSGLGEDISTGTQMIISDSGFMGYYVAQNRYEILDITENYLEVRFITAPPGDTNIAWYMKFTTDPEGGAGSGANMLETEFTTLMFEDEFDQTSLDTSIWNYELGNNSGWGNGEQQYYTDTNATLADGVLSINAVAESINGFNYSSSRITTKDNYEFQYGRMEVRAKLTQGGGTWPAIWMLGSNFETAGWPASGEIDVMEYVGNNPDNVLGTLHFPGNSGGNGVGSSTTVPNAGTEYHNYTLEWSADHIILAVDDVIFHEFQNTATLPFNQPFFIILNVAMGGSLGGDIDPSFVQSTMDVEYVRVYQ